MKNISLGLIVLSAVLITSLGAPQADRMIKVPGYGDQFKTSVYSGYLDVESQTRGLHYVFVESAKGANNSDPVTLWLNGGPGCSSLLGFLQEIGPYYLEEGIKYRQGDNLTKNPYSWHLVSNLLFIESPAGVGFSYNNQTDYVHTDASTAMDSYRAVLNFFNKKFPEYRRNRFWIAGQSYAGKYIPDLAVLLDKYNEQESESSQLNFKGIMVGNGVMTFEDSDLPFAQIDYMIQHSFIDPMILSYYDYGCHVDPESAGCGYFQKRYDQNVEQINPYNVYSYCYYNDSFAITEDDRSRRSGFQSQQSILRKLIRENSKMRAKKSDEKKKFNGAPCAYFDGIFNYFNLNEKEFHAKDAGMKWNGPCANIKYQITPSGSMQEYRYLLARIHKYTISLYNGDWDDVVPYHDTIKNMRALDQREIWTFSPWFTNGQHSGFVQLFGGLVFTTFKGASHQVPQSRRADALNYFNLTLEGHKMFSPRREQATTINNEIKQE